MKKVYVYNPTTQVQFSQGFLKLWANFGNRALYLEKASIGCIAGLDFSEEVNEQMRWCSNIWLKHLPMSQ